MRLSITLLLLLLSVANASADGFLNLPEIKSTGYYAAPAVRWMQINASQTLLLGGRAGLIVNQVYSVGLAGFMSVIDADATIYAEDSYNADLDTRFGYGGLDVEYIEKSDNPLHYTMGIIAGMGQVSYSDPNDSSFDENDTVFVFEPKAQAIYNLTPWCRLGFGVSYRYIQDLDFIGMTKYDLGGFSFTGAVKFGTF